MASEPSTDVDIALLGGSFDPFHLGHLWMAVAALEQLPVGRVELIPAGVSPLKPTGPIATAAQRLQMTRLAAGGWSNLPVEDWETRRHGPSYTVDTLGMYRQKHPDAKLYLIVGADNVASFDRWHRPEEILSLCDVAALHRGGTPPPDFGVLARFTTAERLRTMRKLAIEMPAIELSSTAIRQRVAAGRTIRHQVPPAVAAYIDAEGLYRD